MTFLITWAAKAVGERFAPLLAYGTIILALLGAVWWLRADAYSDGVAATDAAWVEAGELLEKKAEVAAENADGESAERVTEYQTQLTEEKERLDEAATEGSSPLDVLFGA